MLFRSYKGHWGDSELSYESRESERIVGLRPSEEEKASAFSHGRIGKREGREEKKELCVLAQREQCSERENSRVGEQ